MFNHPVLRLLEQRAVDTIQKLKAFVEAAETGTFSAAARRLNVSPSVVTKRINELEDDLGRLLFRRSTRRVTLTDEGQAYFTRIQSLLKDVDDIWLGRFLSPGALEGEIKVRAMTVPTLTVLAKVFLEFRRKNPHVTLNIAMTERPGNPVEEGIDIAIGYDALSYEGVGEEIVSLRQRLLCASPAYLHKRGVPAHPNDLTGHDCLAFTWVGSVWSFKGAAHPINVNVRPVLTANNGELLRMAACDGHGIVELSRHTAEPDLRKGTLVAVLDRFPLADLWMKIMVPQNRMQVARVSALLNEIRSHLFSDQENSTRPVKPPHGATLNNQNAKRSKLRAKR